MKNFKVVVKDVSFTKTDIVLKEITSEKKVPFSKNLFFSRWYLLIYNEWMLLSEQKYFGETTNFEI